MKKLTDMELVESYIERKHITDEDLKQNLYLTVLEYLDRKTKNGEKIIRPDLYRYMDVEYNTFVKLAEYEEQNRVNIEQLCYTIDYDRPIFDNQIRDLIHDIIYNTKTFREHKNYIYIIEGVYFENKTCNEISRELGICSTRICQIKHHADRIIRNIIYLRKLKRDELIY